jgi:hypothetical protein
VKLLSGVIFLNAWPEGLTEERRPSVRILLNSCAIHRLRRRDFDFLEQSMGDRVRVQEICAPRSVSFRYMLLMAAFVSAFLVATGLWWLTTH